MTQSSEMALHRAHSSQAVVGQGRCVQSKWQLLNTVEEAREPLGLKGTSIALLRAMISFVRSDSIDGTRDGQHICFASNATLARRAHVSIQTVERHVAKLVSLGLIARHSSGNGKRWARRSKAGEVVLASGLSLLPLVRRHAEFLALAETYDAHIRAMALLRDKCATALARLASLDLEAAVLDTLKARARTIFRRKPNADVLTQFLAEITAETAKHDGSGTEKMEGRDPRSEGHKEPEPESLVKEETSVSIEVDPIQMERAFPRLCSELRHTSSHRACHQQMDELAAQLGLGPLWFRIKELGPGLSFMVLGYILERIETIKIPKAYARTLLAGLEAGTFDQATLLLRPQRQPTRPNEPCKTSIT